MSCTKNNPLIPNKSFWKDKKVFITGHTGFKGSWLSIILNHLGAKITGYSLAPESNQGLYNLAHIDQKTNSIINNITNYNSLAAAVESAQPDIIFHLAAQSLVLKSYNNPIETYNTNVMGTLNLFESIRNNSPNNKNIVIVNVTSDKCYKNNEWSWPYRETDHLGGKDLYSSSKACSEILAESYRRSFLDNNNIKLLSVRAGNCIGGGDWSENRLIPDLIRAVQDNASLSIRNPNATRPWQHVLDPLTAYILLAEQASTNNNICGSWNIGPESNSIKKVTDVIEQCKRHSNKIKFDLNKLSDATSKLEATFLAVDSSKIANHLGWRNKLNFEQSIEYTLKWYLSYIESSKTIEQFTIDQINQYYNI